METKSSIIELNKEAEQYVIQSSRQRSQVNFAELYGDEYVPLEFVHIADIHAELRRWNRMIEYVNHYSDYISFALHTGDYCGGSQIIYTDLYGEGDRCKKPIFNCTGNHDCYPGDREWYLGEKESVYKLLFNHTEDWDVTFMEGEHSMSYYKDFPESNVRMIVLDLYYDVWETRPWLKAILDDAAAKGLHVFTAMHEKTSGYITETVDINYNTLDDYASAHKAYELKRTEFSFDHRNRVLFEDIIADFIEKGGKYIANLAGHDHVDQFGFTPAGILNLVVQCGTIWDAHNDTKRVEGTKCEDCFNVVGIDTDCGILKVVRIGADVDRYLRKKTAFCYDYINKKVISEA